MVMKATDLGKLHHLPEALVVCRPSLRLILLKRKVRAIFMITVKISTEDFPQMGLPQNDGLGCRLQPIPQMGNAFG
jgi:hypothetical protein